MSDPPIGPAEFDTLQRETFDYFIKEVNPSNGLIADKTKPDSPASIAAVGLALSLYPIGVERDFMDRADAVRRTLATLRFFDGSVQGVDADATGCKGSHYHFLDIRTGKRVWQCELSTIDTASLLAGILTAAAGRIYGRDLLYAGPLFTHQISHLVSMVWSEKIPRRSPDLPTPGFGSFLVEGTTRSLGAEIDRSWTDEGLPSTRIIPLSRFAD